MGVSKASVPHSFVSRVLHRLYLAKLTIIWVLTAGLVLGFIVWGYIDEFCKQCEREDLAAGRFPMGNGAELQRRDDLAYSPTDNNSCLSIQFAPEGSQQLVALASYPGSGNTWLRHLIEHSTGIYTSSVYKDKKLLSGGFRGENHDFMKRTMLGVKMHRCSRKELKKFEALIFLVRNPYNAMVSEWHRYHTSYHKAKADIETFRTKEWLEFVDEESSHWERMTNNCLTNCPRTLVVFYENLLKDVVGELMRIHQFLRIPIDASRLKCTKIHSEGNFHRSGSSNFDPYSAELVNMVNKRIEKGAINLKNLGQVNLPEVYHKVARS